MRGYTVKSRNKHLQRWDKNPGARGRATRLRSRLACPILFRSTIHSIVLCFGNREIELDFLKICKMTKIEKMKKRHICVSCGSKGYEKYYYLIDLPYGAGEVWICCNCYVSGKREVRVIWPKLIEVSIFEAPE